MRYLAVFIIVSAVAVPVHGDLTAYQAFDDPQIDSSILGEEFGIGFNGPWKPWGGAPNNTNLILREGSLEYPGLLTSGHHVAGGDLNGSWVGLSQDLQDQSEVTTKYLSALVRLDGSVMAGFGAMLDGFRSDIAVGASPSSNGRFMIEQFYNIGTQTSDVLIERGETSLLVVKADLREGPDEFTLFVNPTVGEAEPTEGILKDNIDIGDLRGIGIGASGHISVDEIRWGDTFADVTPALIETACNPNSMGDLDGNGKVEFADFLIVANNFGQPAPDHATGDIDCNGMVEFADFLILADNFGKSFQQTSAVPEPSAIELVWGFAMLCVTYSRKRRRNFFSTELKSFS